MNNFDNIDKIISKKINELQNVQYYFRYRELLIRFQKLEDENLRLKKDNNDYYKNNVIPLDLHNIKIDPNISLFEIKKRYILKMLEHFKDNKTQTAEALGITIKTLYNELHSYGEL